MSDDEFLLFCLACLIVCALVGWSLGPVIGHAMGIYP